MTRHTLPNRRPCITSTTEWQGRKITVTVGFYPDPDAPWRADPTRPGEVFADMKQDAPIAAMLSDHCTTSSIAMQHGTPAEALGKSLGTVPVMQIVDGVPTMVDAAASPAGPIIAEVVADVAWIAAAIACHGGQP